MGIASGGSEMGIHSVADNQLIAEVIINDTLLVSPHFKLPRQKRGRQEFLANILGRYVDYYGPEAGPPSLFQAAGLIQSFNFGGVLKELIRVCQTFNRLDNEQKGQWLRGIKNGQRFSSNSFKPAGEFTYLNDSG